MAPRVAFMALVPFTEVTIDLMLAPMPDWLAASRFCWNSSTELPRMVNRSLSIFVVNEKLDSVKRLPFVVLVL